jgi:membrane-bound lytic murein transglycosylase D
MKDIFEKRIADIPEDKRTTWRFHVVQPGESLETIASSFRDRASELAAVNKLAADDPVAAGDELVVPVAASLALPHPLRYTTRAGDTLVTVADRFNVSVEDLRRWNHLTSSRVGARRSLYVSAPVRLAPATHVRSRKTKGTPVASARATSAHSPSARHTPGHTKTSHRGSVKTAAHSKRTAARH